MSESQRHFSLVKVFVWVQSQAAIGLSSGECRPLKNRQFLLTAALLTLVSPVYATCENYTDGSVSGPAPRAVLCYKGKCDDTTLNVECGSVGSGNYAEYGNGLIISQKTEENAVFTNTLGRKMRGEDWTCTQITGGGL